MFRFRISELFLKYFVFYTGSRSSWSITHTMANQPPTSSAYPTGPPNQGGFVAPPYPPPQLGPPPSSLPPPNVILPGIPPPNVPQPIPVSIPPPPVGVPPPSMIPTHIPPPNINVPPPPIAAPPQSIPTGAPPPYSASNVQYHYGQPSVPPVANTSAYNPQHQQPVSYPPPPIPQQQPAHGGYHPPIQPDNSQYASVQQWQGQYGAIQTHPSQSQSDGGSTMTEKSNHRDRHDRRKGSDRRRSRSISRSRSRSRSPVRGAHKR